MQEGAKNVNWKVIWLCLQLPSPLPQGRASPGQEVDLTFQFDLCTFNLGWYVSSIQKNSLKKKSKRNIQKRKKRMGGSKDFETPQHS